MSVPAPEQCRGQQDVLHRARGILRTSAAPRLSRPGQLISDSAKPGAGMD